MRGILHSSSFKSYLCGAVPVQKEAVKLWSDLRICPRERCQDTDASSCGEVADRLYSAGNHAGLSCVGVSILLTNHTASLFGAAFSFPADGWGLKLVWVCGGFTLRKWFCSPTGESSRRLACDLPLRPVTAGLLRSSRVNLSYNTSWKCSDDALVHGPPPQWGSCLDGYSRAVVTSLTTGERQNLLESGRAELRSGTVNQRRRNLLRLGGRRALSRLVRVIKKHPVLTSFSVVRRPLPCYRGYGLNLHTSFSMSHIL